MDSLHKYNTKRDFTKTAEPSGKARAKSRARRHAGDDIFVVQKHDATRLHYDFRLALDGVLVSWAVTKGPSLVPGEKRLAVHVEDHPYDYAGFEGVIPEGNYGAGPVIVWDRGHWHPEGDPHKGLKKGHLDFTLDGEKLKGRWHLVRMRARPHEKQDPWLLIKGDDEAARPKSAKDILKAEPRSVLTGRLVEEVEQGKPAPSKKRTATAKASPKKKASPRTGASARAKKTKAKSASGGAKGKEDRLPDFVAPCLATLVSEPPEGEEWVHEIKFDGYRTEARIDNGKLRFLTRTGLDWTRKFGRLAEPFAALSARTALIDGEIVVETEDGASDFSELQAALKGGEDERLVYYAFDLLHLDGEDLRRLPLAERKARLKALLAGVNPEGALRYSENFTEEGELMLRHACRMKLEGIVSKRVTAPYRSGRGMDWQKSKCAGRQEFVIVGYSPSTVTARAVGALAVGYFNGDDLVYAGRIGTGYTQKTAGELWRALHPLEGARPHFTNEEAIEAPRKTRWVEPKLVAEIEFRGWTGSNVLRHAAFKGLRQDKAARDVVREDPPQAPPKEKPMRKTAAKKSTRKRAAKKPPASSAQGADLADALTHPDKLLWADAGITKLDLAEYYSEIWDWIAPHIVGRPLALIRCPDGTAKKCFFQKHAWAGLDENLVHRHKAGGDEVLSIDSPEGLVALVQAGVLEIHPWGTTVADIEHADTLTFDLDPDEGLDWKDVVSAAKKVRSRLEDAGLAAFLKNTGGKGLHIVTPLAPSVPWDEAKAFAQSIADAMEADEPDRFVATVSKRARAGKIFVDYLRNGRGATAVAAYSTRARAGAPVSTPLAWDELTVRIRPDHFNVKNLRQRLARLKRDPWADFRASARPLPGSGSKNATPARKKRTRR
ncbi:DNA ligase D [Parvibaculum sp.]|uniref:DNA ligase D n=1 Tax=Parvibaculum sp. TaxID=2024848 RepID=UPI002B5E715E|nr:DNA ligase D [Parvibaculum sp.]HUD51485.1 DNA ligase D [Parvibaculum sp.]